MVTLQSILFPLVTMLTHRGLPVVRRLESIVTLEVTVLVDFIRMVAMYRVQSSCLRTWVRGRPLWKTLIALLFPIVYIALLFMLFIEFVLPANWLCLLDSISKLMSAARHGLVKLMTVSDLLATG